MRHDRALRERMRRIRKIGAAGIARRLRDRLGASERTRLRAAWRARHEGRCYDEAGLAAALGVEASALDAALRDTWTASRERFWLDAADPALRESFLARHPEDARLLAEQARRALAGDLAWVVPGGVPDWHAALPGDERWPLAPSESIAIGAARPIGDVRLAWETGRCTDVLRLAQAAWLAEDRALAARAVERFEDWIAANPPGLGIAWAHAQEVALRAVAWLFAIELLRPLGVVDASLLRRLTWLLQVHAEYVACHATDDPITHNHLVSECFGLVAIGTALPRLHDATRWQMQGFRILWREVEKQVDLEGVHGEGSTHYHAFVLDSLVATLLLADRAGVAVPPRARARVAAMAEALATWMREDGSIPAIGDTDAGRGWRFGPDPLDRRDVLAAAAVAFDRPDLGARAGHAAGAFWLVGGRTVPGAGERPSRGGARRFGEAGIGVARSDAGPASELVLFRAGRTAFRPDVLLSHMHADALSIVWRVGGRDVLVDPGTFLYSEGEGWRVAMRRTAAHSCVTIDGRDQADVTSQRFGVAGEQASRWISFDGDDRHLHACAEHPATGPLRVRRRVAWRAGLALAFCDDVLGTGLHRVESWLQLPATDGASEPGAARLRFADGSALRIQVFGDAERIEALRPLESDGPGPGWRAPRYGRRAPGTAIRIDAGERPLPARIVVLMLVAPPGAEPATGRLIRAEADTVEIETDGLRIHFEGTTGVRSEERP